MAVTNVFFTTNYTSMLQRVVQEVVSDPTKYLGVKYIPSRNVPSDVVQADIIEAYGGLTIEHSYDSDVEYVQKPSTRTEEFKPGVYREAIHWGEADILKLRKLGQNDRSQRGIRQYINMSVDKLNLRLEQRLEKLRWDAIFTGGFSYFNRTFSYGIPSTNQVTPIGAVWSTDGINANNAANPLTDLRFWCTGGQANFRKYKITKIISNPNTARWFLDNTNVRAYIQNAMANPTFKSYGVNEVAGFFIPGAPEWEIYDGWYMTESYSDTNNPNRPVASNANYFIPDGYLFFETALPDQNQIGELQLGLNLADGSIDNPGMGKFLVVDENVAPGTKGGPGNPWIDIVCGANAGVNLYRAFDVLTAKVV